MHIPSMDFEPSFQTDIRSEAESKIKNLVILLANSLVKVDMCNKFVPVIKHRLTRVESCA